MSAKKVVDVKEIRIRPERRSAYNAVMVRFLMEEAEFHRNQGREAQIFLKVRVHNEIGETRQVVQMVAYDKE
ncbi:TPA: hypothetical protein SL686_000828 [Pseudomonas aeruginosa]|uniref:hypothetical protein n=1 Tax=Pseudomonas aeruginosa TaxID=287 RepID=UPI0003B99171|nr:hypothetical protein [Pseudomonas aeruginosa]ERV79192.1 hypothetical protein Q058_02163 [Pseudomonas aeruginosa BL04]KSD80013.1 hypothetical protein AO903_00830 [Pseudomonas aeruginosa]MCS7890915.1 hypothetical protein [Pseudomonas aeruginosa]MDV7781981.1 hypothetical protein [Pseudomonas aeruginosa]UKW03067.1 hypothetical protein MCN99_04690 [Pseudomonas aeruginosa]